MRQAGDALAWEAIAAGAAAGEVRVVTVGDASGEASPLPLPGLEGQVAAGLEYDQMVELMEWADKVVVW